MTMMLNGSNALMEAMVLGLAAISTDCPCGGPKDLITPQENGILIPVDDTIALTREMERLMKEPTFREKLSRNAMLLKESVMPDRVNMEWEEYLTQIAQ